jgi:hypothetical protein
MPTARPKERALENGPPILWQVMSLLMHRDQHSIPARHFPQLLKHVKPSKRDFAVGKLNVDDGAIFGRTLPICDASCVCVLTQFWISPTESLS